MNQLNLIISENITTEDLIKSLETLDIDEFELQCIMIHEQILKEDIYSKNFGNAKIKVKQMSYPEDEAMGFKDIWDELIYENTLFYHSSLELPSDFFQQLFLKENSEEGLPNREASQMERSLKAMQQSKYGLGIVKKDISRDFEYLRDYCVYKTSELKTSKFSELEIDESMAQAATKIAHKSQLTRIYYHPDYKQIEYFTDVASYLKALKSEAPLLSYQNKSNASGIPLYMLIMVWLSLLVSFAFPPAFILFLSLFALYFLSIGLEALAISTIKRQGELFINLFFLFPIFHHLYLWFYVFGKRKN